MGEVEWNPGEAVLRLEDGRRLVLDTLNLDSDARWEIGLEDAPANERIALSVYEAINLAGADHALWVLDTTADVIRGSEGTELFAEAMLDAVEHEPSAGFTPEDWNRFSAQLASASEDRDRFRLDFLRALVLRGDVSVGQALEYLCQRAAPDSPALGDGSAGELPI
jgi:hypothetical protein